MAAADVGAKPAAREASSALAITDACVSNELAGRAAASSLPGWLAWVAILIDYLELPVIFDTFRRAARAIAAGARSGEARGGALSADSAAAPR